MRRILSGQPDRLGTWQALLLALAIDFPFVLFFIYRIVVYDINIRDTDIEMTIFLWVMPLFFGVNTLLLAFLYRILSNSQLSWLASGIIAIAVFLISYPASYITSNMTSFFPLKYPEDKLYIHFIFFIISWLMATGVGLAIMLFIIRRTR